MVELGILLVNCHNYANISNDEKIELEQSGGRTVCGGEGEYTELI